MLFLICLLLITQFKTDVVLKIDLIDKYDTHAAYHNNFYNGNDCYCMSLIKCLTVTR